MNPLIASKGAEYTRQDIHQNVSNPHLRDSNTWSTRRASDYKHWLRDVLPRTLRTMRTGPNISSDGCRLPPSFWRMTVGPTHVPGVRSFHCLPSTSNCPPTSLDTALLMQSTMWSRDAALITGPTSPYEGEILSVNFLRTQQHDFVRSFVSEIIHVRSGA